MRKTDWAGLLAEATHSNAVAALFHGDAASTLCRLPSASVDTCVTSPPYWGVRDYGVEGQIGLEEDIEGYVERLAEVFEELYRVLKPSGSVWLNIGDKYLNGVSTVGGQPPRRGWKRNKQLGLVPFRVAMALQEQGWWLRNTVVWHKPNGMPASVNDRLAAHWEPVFLLTKAERYYFDLDAVREPHKTDDAVERRRAVRGENQGFTKGEEHLRKWLNSPRHRATIDGVKSIERRPNAPDAVELAAYLRHNLKLRGLSIAAIAEALGLPFERTRHYFRTDRIGARLPPPETWSELKVLLDLDSTYDEAMALEIGDNTFRNHPNGRNPGDVRTIGIGPNDTKHIATMPLKLAEWCLKSTLPPNGVCIDPFMGSGTTGVAALEQGGRFIGIDLALENMSIASSRMRLEEKSQVVAAE